MKGILFTCIGLGVLAVIFVIISGPLFDAGIHVMMNTVDAGVMVP